MKKKSFKRIAAAALAFMMVAQSASGLATVQAADATQMSSDKEVVYVNTYDASVREQNFDDNWKFYLGEASGAEAVAFDDSAWRNVNLPHDYSIEQEYTLDGEAESGYLLGGTGWYRKHFTLSPSMEGKEIRIDFGGVYMNATVWVNGTQLGTHPYGYTPFSFDITDYVSFDQENVITVKVDHETPSSRWYSGSGIYRSVNLTVMDKVHVDLYGTQITTPNLEAEKNSTVNMSVKTTVANEGTSAANVVLTHTVYEKGTENSIGTVTTDAQSVAAGESAEISATLPANKPALWSVEDPNLYTVTTEVKVGNNVVDTYDTEFGFRYFEFDKDTGFYLNGEAMKLKGVCMHHDQGSLGSEAYYRAIERQVEILQEMGCNSIRVTHNPASEELIEICNEKGMLLVEEVFDGLMYPKNGNSNDYSVWFETEVESGNQIIGADAAAMAANDTFLGGKGLTWAQFDLTATIKRGYNSPAIIMWSLGNEIWEGAGGHAQFPAVVETLIGWASALDSTRPSTTGDNNLKGGTANSPWSYEIAADLSAAGGITGANYCDGNMYDYVYNYFKNTEGFALYGAETASATNSRGVYYTTANNTLTAEQTLTSYDYSSVGWGAVASAAWYDIITRDYVAGEYVWTGFDYLGEPTPANGTGKGQSPYSPSWPSPKNSFFGIVDTAGLPKDSYYFYQSQWNDDVTTLHVLPAWNEDVVVSGNVPIVVYSDAAAVELFFTDANGNKESLGKKEFTKHTTGAGYTYQMYEGTGASSATHQNMYLTWYKAFEEGTIEAVAYDESGNKITNTEGRSYVTTTGDEAVVRAEVDRDTITADGKDLAYITVDITDEEGNIVPDASNNVKFTVEGDGVLVGVDNGKQPDHQSFQDDNRDAYNGSLVAIVQSTKEAGSFTVTATSAGLTSDSVTVTTTAADGSTGEKAVKSFYMSKNYYVQTGTAVQLPETIETRYTDGTSEELRVVWDNITATTGSFGVNGVVDEKYTVSVMVNMIDEVAGLLNYSTATSVGVAPVLPAGRQAVLADGTILDVSFPVTWADIDESAYAETGTFTVIGASEVFGKAMTVTATVRVQEEEIDISGSVDNPMAGGLTQDIPEELQSDTLSAIWDGSTVKDDNNEGGKNLSAWSNYTNSQTTDSHKGDNTAEITFQYATQQRIGEVVIYFWEDTHSACYPDEDTTKIWISETGTDGSWVKVDTKETRGAEVNDVKPYTYTFDSVYATFIKFCITNGAADRTVAPCTGITEIEIKKAVGSYTTNTTAELEALEVNGTALTANQIASGAYYTLANAASVEYTSADNAAVTVLPAYEKEILLIIESEDHKTRETFTIYLEQEAPLDPSDNSNDISLDGMAAISGSQYLPATPNEGPDDYILDGNPNTHWHTHYDTTEGSDVKNRWVGVNLTAETEIGGIRFLPRTYNGANGAVTEYKIQYRTSDDGEWTDIEGAAGIWNSSDSSWKLVTFDTVTAKQVRIVGVHTWDDKGGENSDAHMSAAEFRVVAPASGGSGETPTPEVVATGIEVGTLPTKTEYKYGEALDTTGLVVNKVYSDGTKEALAAIDYTVSGYNAEKEGKQAVIITCGDFTAAFTVNVTKDGETPGVTPTPDKPGVTPTPTPGAKPTPTPGAKPTPTPDKPFRFDDVQDKDAYYFDPVYWAYENDITTGETKTLFAPDKEVNRAAMVTFIWRAEGEDKAKNTVCTFKDVDPSHFYYDAMLWAVEEGITQGYNAETFGPNDGCTRAQMVTFLWRAAGEPKVNGANPFKDVSSDAYYYNAVLWAVENNITTGVSATSFEPDSACTRGQAVTFLARAYE